MFTFSPGCFSHLPMVPSVTDSPSLGIFSSNTAKEHLRTSGDHQYAASSRIFVAIFSGSGMNQSS